MVVRSFEACGILGCLGSDVRSNEFLEGQLYQIVRMNWMIHLMRTRP